MWLRSFMAILLAFQFVFHFKSSQAAEDLSEFDIPDATAIPIGLSSDELGSLSGDESDFQAEVNRLMEIIINSLYKTRDIFLRELISNSVDALDKIRYESLKDKNALNGKSDLEIRVQVDKDAQTLTLIDSGIGMTADELRKNLGTVAHSGTASFLDKIADQQKESGGENSEAGALAMIGQFGVGFYSAFLVADEVMVVSKSNKDDTQNIWRSKADGKFSVSPDPRGNTLGRGTALILKIKEDATEFLENEAIQKIIQRYSEFTQYPIYLYDSKTETVEEEIPAEELEKEAEEKGSDEDDLGAEDESVDDDSKSDEPKTRKVEKTSYFWRRLNSNKPIWSKRRSQVTQDEYNGFYKAFTKETEDPLAQTHFKAEGELEFDSMLFIPSKAPQGFFDSYYNAKSKLRLYVRRVLVADEFEDIIPRYLNFVRGLVDSNDLPLNVNREDLQKNRIMTLISRKLTRKVLDLLRTLANEEEDDDEDEDEDEEEGDPDDEEEDEEKKEEGQVSRYSTFWNEFGKSIKLGVLEDSRNRKRLIELLRFTSTKSPDTPISLRKYVENMQSNQKFIYYISAASVDEAESSPFLERFRRKGFEVLYFIDNLDEYLNLQDYDEIKFQSVSKENVELDGKAMKAYLDGKEEEFSDLKDWFKSVYGTKITKVQISPTLDTTPMAIATSSFGYSARMQQIAKNQAFGAAAPMRASKILQINYRHPIIIGLKNLVDDGEEESDEIKDLAHLLLDMALVQSGFDIESDEQAEFGERIARVVQAGLNIPPDAKLEPEPEFADADDDENEDDDFEDFMDEEDEDDDDKDEL